LVNCGSLIQKKLIRLLRKEDLKVLTKYRYTDKKIDPKNAPLKAAFIQGWIEETGKQLPDSLMSGIDTLIKGHTEKSARVFGKQIAKELRK
jgi:hypothetical protein